MSRAKHSSMPNADFAIGWICASAHELSASRAMLDKEFGAPEDQDPHDDNIYVLGQIAGHNVVLASLAAGKYGNEPAVTVAKDMLRTFTSMKFGLLVGIGGGVPSRSADIRLGDVVVSKPSKSNGGVIQYDMGKVLPNGAFERRGILNKPPDALLKAVQKLSSQHEMEGSNLDRHLEGAFSKYPKMRKPYSCPGRALDRLYAADKTCGHTDDVESCEACQNHKVVERTQRLDENGNPDETPYIHYGLIGSGSSVIASADQRDRLYRDAEILCFEMEAAGLMDAFPCLVIRGISDYADSSKEDTWQRYAAATAAAYAKELISVLPVQRVGDTLSAATTMRQASPSGETNQYGLGLDLSEAPENENHELIGRTSEIETLENLLVTNAISTGRRAVVLQGLGGMGKTQLARSFAERYQTSFSTVFWLNAKSEVKLRQAFLRLAQRIRNEADYSFEKTDENEQNTVNQVQSWLSIPNNQRWLLIFDNYDEPYHAKATSPEAFDLKKYFPFREHGSILITTRSILVTHGKVIQLHKLSLEESTRILLKRSGREENGEDSDAEPIARRLDGLPLALSTAGNYLKYTPVSFVRYIAYYQSSWNELKETAESLVEYDERTLYTTWNLSLKSIEDQAPAGGMLLQFLAYFDTQDIWYELLKGGSKKTDIPILREVLGNEVKFYSTMKMLQNYSLVEMNNRRNTYSLHVCVHDWATHYLNGSFHEDLYWTAVHSLVKSAPDISVKAPHVSRRWWPHVNRLTRGPFWYLVELEAAPRKFDDIRRIAAMLVHQGKFADASAIYKLAVDGMEDALDADDPRLIKLLNNCSLSYRNSSRLEESEALMQRALRSSLKVHSEQDPMTLRIMHNLGLLYIDLMRYDEAEELIKRVLKGREEKYGINDPSSLGTIHKLGMLHKKQGKFDEAEAMYRRAMKGREEVFGPNHHLTLQTLKNFASMNIDQGDYDQGIKNLQRVLVGREELLGESHPSTLKIVDQLAKAYARADIPEEASRMRKKRSARRASTTS